jgi:ABC-type Fe3+/spermidine/putrescine transport system ATPase subunit
LSGGEAQRVSLARTLITLPEIVFLDEPLAALDTPTRDQMIRELPELLRSRSAVFVTHDHGEARRLASKVAVMLDGKIAAHGLVEEVFFRPTSLPLARFLGVENLVPARQDGNGVVLPDGERLQCNGSSSSVAKVVLCLRAESVRIGLNGARDDDIRLRGRIECVEPRALGQAVSVGFAGFKLEARAYSGDAERYRLEPGEPIDVHFHRKLLHFVPHRPD